MRSGGMSRPRVTFSRNGSTSSGPSGPPKETSSTASNAATCGHNSLAEVALILTAPQLLRTPGTSVCSVTSPYMQLLRVRGGWQFSAAGFIARLPLSMAGVALILLMVELTDSYFTAGAVVATLTLAGAAVAPTIGALTDRFGQTRVIGPQIVVNILGFTSLLILAAADAPTWTLLRRRNRDWGCHPSHRFGSPCALELSAAEVTGTADRVQLGISRRRVRVHHRSAPGRDRSRALERFGGRRADRIHRCRWHHRAPCPAPD